jgi:hypothetical protein
MSENIKSWWWVVLVVAGVVVSASAFVASDENRGTSSDGVQAVAKVVGARDGDCAVGVQRQHCFELELEVQAKDGA